jgi:hypothetical protein
VSLLFSVASLFVFEGGNKSAMERLYTTAALAYVSERPSLLLDCC